MVQFTYHLPIFIEHWQVLAGVITIDKDWHEVKTSLASDKFSNKSILCTW